MIESHTKIPLKCLTCYDKDKQRAWFFAAEGLFLHVYSAVDFSVVCTSFWLEAHTTYEVLDAVCIQGEIFLTVTRMKKDDSSETLNLVVKASKIEDAPQIMHPNKELPMTDKIEENSNPLKGSLELTSDDAAATEQACESEELGDLPEDETLSEPDGNVHEKLEEAVMSIISTRLWHMSPTCVVDLSQVVALWQVASNDSFTEYALIFAGTTAPVIFKADKNSVKDFADLMASWELSKESEVKENLLAHNPGWIV